METKTQSPSKLKDLNKKQIKVAAKLIIGCVALYSDFGLDEAETTDNDIRNVAEQIQELAFRMLGKNESFPNTKDIIQYVRDNF